MKLEIISSRYIPGNGGTDCRYNGKHFSLFGSKIECECDGCDYILCCVEMKEYENCFSCRDVFCPHSPKYEKSRLERFADWLSGKRKN